MFDAPATTPDAPAAPAERRAEARVRRLQRMADLGVDIGEKLQRQAELAAAHAETDAVPDNLPHARRLDEIARSFAQVSRAVSLATALEDRIDRGLPALPFEDRARQERDARDKRGAAARAVAPDFDAFSPRRAIDLRLRLDRLLDAELADLDRFLDRPFDEIVARLRRDLGLESDASPPPRRRRGGGGPPKLVEGAAAATLQDGPPLKTSKPASASPLHRRSAVPLPHAFGLGEESRITPPP